MWTCCAGRSLQRSRRGARRCARCSSAAARRRWYRRPRCPARPFRLSTSQPVPPSKLMSARQVSQAGHTLQFGASLQALSGQTAKASSYQLTILFCYIWLVQDICPATSSQVPNTAGTNLTAGACCSSRESWTLWRRASASLPTLRSAWRRTRARLTRASCARTWRWA